MAATSLRSSSARKAEHLRINLAEDVSSEARTGLDEFRFRHLALPEIDLAGVDLATAFLDRRLGAPFLISCMTGGTEAAQPINQTLAAVAQRHGFALGLGSGRALLEQPELLPTFDVRHLAPDVPLLANLGAVQLNRGVTVDGARRLVDLLGADALVLHLNPLQEALQPSGDVQFGQLLERIETLCRTLGVPVIAKEVGFGIGEPDAVRLAEAGVYAIDVAGAGGTSWSEVERHRLSGPMRNVAAAFRGWGTPTADCLVEVRGRLPRLPLIASGGIRNGVQAAVALALGADLVGVAGPLLRAAARGESPADDLAGELVETLRRVLFCTGAANLEALRQVPLAREGPFRSEGVEFELQTGAGPSFHDITERVQASVAHLGLFEGMALVSSLHTTAAVVVNEDEPLLHADFGRFLDRLAPHLGYEHDDLSRRQSVPPDEPINGHSHCQQLLLGQSTVLPVARGRLRLGTWQRVFLVELDGSRHRRVRVQSIGR
jgi:isopentenyl-diphosphate delta-isomerase